MSKDIKCPACDNGHIHEYVCCGKTKYMECCGSPDVDFIQCELCEGFGYVDKDNEQYQLYLLEIL